MKKTFVEELVLFVSIIKWAILASGVGIVVGFSTAVFLKLLGLSSGLIQAEKYYFLFLPLVLFLSSLIVSYLAPEAEGHGTEKVIEAVHKRWGKIKLAVVPVKLIATIITLAGGGSAGKEGPCAQIGAGLASGMADILKLNREDRKKLVICGISAGFAAVFGTPIAGALFAVEVLVLGKVLQEILFPSLVAAIISYQTAFHLGIDYSRHYIRLTGFSQAFFTQIILCEVLFGLIALLLIESLKLFEKFAHQLFVWKPLRGLIGGTLLVLLAFMFSPIYLGLGTDTIEATLNGDEVASSAFLWKILFTSVTLSMGGSGGIITPIFFIGSTAGSAVAHIFNFNPATFAAIGMVALLAGAANTPIAASVMAIETFGPQIGPFAAIACVVSYIASGHRSVYSSQVLGVAKSASISVPLMTDFYHIDEVKVEEKPGKLLFFIKGLIGVKSKTRNHQDKT